MRRIGILLAACVALFAQGAAQAQPSGVRVAPVTLALPAGKNVDSLRLDNGRSLPVSFQVDAYAWTQENGRDVLTPTRAIAAAPSVFEVPPGGGRLVRVALSPSGRDATKEQAFRLIIKELPTGASPVGRARILLELSIPVFATVQNAAPMLSVSHDAGGVRLANAGRAHVRLVGVQTDAHGAAATSFPRYLLAGSSAPLDFPQAARAARVSFLTLGATAPSEQVLALAPDPVLVASRRP